MDKRPKLCLLAASPLTIHFFLKLHIRKLAEDFDVTLIYNPKIDTYVLPLELPVREIPLGIQRKMTPLTDVLTLIQLVKIFRKEHFDIIISVVPKAGLLGMIAAAITQTKHRVHIFQGQVWASANGFKRRLLKAMDMVTALCATTLLAVSPSEKKFLEDQRVARRGKVAVLGQGSISGVDLFRFRPNIAFRASIRKRCGIPSDSVLCVFLGRLAVDKGVHELVSAFNICARTNSNLWLLLAGPDEEDQAASLRDLIAPKYADRLIIEGFTTVPEQYLAAADFLCLPSYREGFGMVVIEASAAEIPAIGSCIYGISDAIVDQQTGLLVPPRDAESLANAISMLSTDTEKRLMLGRAGRLRVESEFEKNKVVDRYVQFFKDLASDEKTA